MKSKNYRPIITICLQPSLTCLMVLSICGKENIMKQNNPCYLFGMYEPDTNSVIINAINDTYSGTLLTISCEKCNSSVLLDTPYDIMYLYRLAQSIITRCNKKHFLSLCYVHINLCLNCINKCLFTHRLYNSCCSKN